MNIETVSKAQIAQEFLADTLPAKMGLSIRVDGAYFSASCYYPNGDCSRDKFCHGHAATVAEAVDIMLAKIDAVKNAAPVLKTAAECKEAVLNLIREHDAAPASFRDAVDALPVKG
ncbi:hypothetical protein K7W03_14260 [Sphingobium sp. PNB]|uniref:hypothetical protein n=1 Tax=Sphingobium sp. PNB TaxID=863934 RepID=UPI001CA3A519|nr:hypothetical protein [Sphingobium sp. PNB]MCB4860755.1 hypothetical protein [Sphingobium sp. PNB]